MLLSQLAVQSKLAVASSKELTHLHELVRKQENQHRLVSYATIPHACVLIAEVNTTQLLCYLQGLPADSCW